jgi:hypothetical protein
MKNRNRTIILIQAVLIFLMSGAASFSLSPYTGLWTAAVFIGLAGVGALSIVFPKMGALPFLLLTIFAALTGILSHSIIDIGVRSFSGGTNNPVKVWGDSEPLLAFTVITVVGLVLISGYIALSLLNNLFRDYSAMSEGEIDANEAEFVTERNIRTGGALLGTGVAISVIFTVILKLVQPPLADVLKMYPWSILVFGLSAILLLGGFIYWLVMGRQATREK